MHMGGTLRQHQGKAVFSVHERHQYSGPDIHLSRWTKAGSELISGFQTGGLEKRLRIHSGVSFSGSIASPLPTKSTGRFSGSNPNLATFPPCNAKKGAPKMPPYVTELKAQLFSAFALRLGSFSLIRADLPERSRR